MLEGPQLSIVSLVGVTVFFSRVLHRSGISSEYIVFLVTDVLRFFFPNQPVFQYSGIGVLGQLVLISVCGDRGRPHFLILRKQPYL